MLGQIFVGLSDETIYEEVKQVMPGCNLLLKNGKIKINKYWSLKLKRNKLSFIENNERFKDLFFQSLKYRLRSDVEVGSCLSGGLDSSSIVSFASKKFTKRFHTFTLIWPGEKCDEVIENIERTVCDIEVNRARLCLHLDLCNRTASNDVDVHSRRQTFVCIF